VTTRLLASLALIATSAFVLADGSAVQSATLTVSYEAGHLDVSINDYRTDGMGTFRLVDGADDVPALCIEADQPHSSTDDAYREVSVGTPSNELDTLIWLVSQIAPDDDTATAAAALAWFYAGAERSIGEPVWSNWALDYQPIGPVSPEPWDALAPFGMSHPVGLRTGRDDLEVVERRVAAVHRPVLAWGGPWQLSAHPDLGRFRLVGSAGPIGGQPMTITVAPTGSDPFSAQVVTDVDGFADVALDPAGLPDGAVVHASLGAPGPHREWDGEGAVQRMITATVTPLAASFEVSPLTRHITVAKRSTDPTIGVAGGMFALIDARGSEVERIVTDSDGRATFAPIDPALHPVPYTVHEVEPPPGLARTAPDVVVSDASTVVEHPTIAEFTDKPLEVPVAIRKELSVPVGPDDRTGFAFSIVRAQDGRAVEVASGPSGTTDRVALPVGTYELCEIAVPRWAAAFRDGGCQTIEIDLDRAVTGDAITVPYLNIVPPPMIDTVARDDADGDQVLGPSGGRVVDSVLLSGLVAGSKYALVAELIRIGPGDSYDPFGVAQSRTIDFVADADTARLEVRFEVPALDATALVVVERLFVGDEIVAAHDDLTDPDQTLTIVAPVETTTTVQPTTTTSTTTTSTTTATTTSTSTTTPSTTVLSGPLRTTSTTQYGTLPRTGTDETARLLRLGDVGFAIGVMLMALAGLLPRRQPGRR
jgi:hypothetical protein